MQSPESNDSPSQQDPELERRAKEQGAVAELKRNYKLLKKAFKEEREFRVNLENELMTAQSKEKKDWDAKGQDSGLHDELVVLQRQVKSLEQKKNAPASAREEALERELQLMKDQIAEKDSQLTSMEDKLKARDEDLSYSQKEANEKQAAIDELKADVEKMKTLASESSSSQVLEENHMMSTQLVALAQAFEKSENSRAEVLEKVESERHAHAERLKQLTFNMKRFYATLKMSDV